MRRNSLPTGIPSRPPTPESSSSSIRLDAWPSCAASPGSFPFVCKLPAPFRTVPNQRRIKHSKKARLHARDPSLDLLLP